MPTAFGSNDTSTLVKYVVWMRSLVELTDKEKKKRVHAIGTKFWKLHRQNQLESASTVICQQCYGVDHSILSINIFWKFCSQNQVEFVCLLLSRFQNEACESPYLIFSVHHAIALFILLFFFQEISRALIRRKMSVDSDDLAIWNRINATSTGIKWYDLRLCKNSRTSRGCKLR